MGPSPLLNFAEELLVEIFKGTGSRPYDRQKHLRTLSLVCQKFHRISAGMLLTSPCVHLYKTHELIRTYFDYPELAERAHTLELVNMSFTSRSDKPLGFTELYDLKSKLVLDSGLKAQCVEFIRSKKIMSKVIWIQNLDDDSLSACMAILLALLPNLRALYMGANSINEYPFFGAFTERRVMSIERYEKRHPKMDLSILLWPHIYFDDIFEAVWSKLHTLELPCDWNTSRSADRYWKRHMRRMSLRQLALPMNRDFGPSTDRDALEDWMTRSSNIIPPTV
ncbi:hypothetical protein K491DRAFT_719416 [Lophiostoma macrostomum CBS 122681]|uniref:F-box domain-containing protein n=1 Tax=Lophiostoma macrostomum CBS 122681 TaxID=1314788 RepID=A0A6A6SW29_9PLEO|nr:hypothetical protein K491DRAFT_719416 [Lophiostoma macrostomum CBS 122681]